MKNFILILSFVCLFFAAPALALTVDSSAYYGNPIFYTDSGQNSPNACTVISRVADYASVDYVFLSNKDQQYDLIQKLGNLAVGTWYVKDLSPGNCVLGRSYTDDLEYGKGSFEVLALPIPSTPVITSVAINGIINNAKKMLFILSARQKPILW